MHAKKFTKSESVHLLGHIKREHLHYSNENIDLSKSHLNFIYQNRTVDSVLDGVYIHGKNGKSADKINYTVSMAIHYPTNCPISEKEFFGYMNYILSNKFGKDNVVCSVVHYDEKRSHMHFVFCPIVESKKHGRKLCCKEVVNRDMLQSLHEDIEKELFALCGKTVSLRNEEEIRGIPYVDDIEVYKKLKDLESKVQSITEYAKNLEDYANKLEEYCDSKINELNGLKLQIQQKRKELSSIFDNNSLDDIIKGYSDFGRGE